MHALSLSNAESSAPERERRFVSRLVVEELSKRAPSRFDYLERVRCLMGVIENLVAIECKCRHRCRRGRKNRAGDLARRINTGQLRLSYPAGSLSQEPDFRVRKPLDISQATRATRRHYIRDFGRLWGRCLLRGVSGDLRCLIEKEGVDNRILLRARSGDLDEKMLIVRGEECNAVRRVPRREIDDCLPRDGIVNG